VLLSMPCYVITSAQQREFVTESIYIIIQTAFCVEHPQIAGLPDIIQHFKFRTG
jgi:hypothetical protein